MEMIDLIDVPDVKSAVKACTEARDAEMFLYSGPIYSRQVNEFLGSAMKSRRRPNVTLILTTYGGDAHAAYRMARALQSYFRNIRLLVVGPCKSAGTLVTLCADELAFGPFGELGPLDIQVTKKDDLMSVASGLDTFQAVSILQNQAFSAFEECMLNLLEGSQGAISTTTACQIASQLVTSLFQPIAAQIDPQRMGEVERMMEVARAYGERLGTENLRSGALTRLIESYPSHSFIIDYKEARRLFKKVSRITPDEIAVLCALQERISHPACVFLPAGDIVFADVSTLSIESSGGNHEAGTSHRSDSPPHDAGQPGEARAQEGKEPRRAQAWKVGRGQRRARAKPNGALPYPG
jgi:serine dehydrogenase proteinase